MIALSDENIRSFQALYKSSFGMDISRQEAYEKGLKLLRLMEIVYQPMTEEEHNIIQQHMKDRVPVLLTRLQNHEPRIYFDQRNLGEKEGTIGSA